MMETVSGDVTGQLGAVLASFKHSLLWSMASRFFGARATVGHELALPMTAGAAGPP